ncbi:hybrid sensor histidine kinase/response regulator [Christiangramia salexigens]|uniref:histidine kinase n=1 Tax=Christiangramia salexigens TaxID=1913577 RepID=A0A1L3J793_9FLAO|nr:ATP-binding protein [Christiangramia salexigens]APG60988.1 hybrid sensor histidine kinase/response regulator [Christiangramia salexigens]
MFHSRRSITVKIVAGYVIVAILAGLAVWYIYNQVIDYSQIAQSNTENNQQLILVSEITTSLNQSENTSRRLIQTGSEEELALYNTQIDSIKFKLQRLEANYGDINLENEADNLTKLLEQKTENLKELVALRDTDRNTNYYSRVLRELKKVDASFADKNYEQRFANLEPHQRRVLIRLLEYAKEDNAQELTNQRLDSLVSSVKKVLTELEIANRQFRNAVNEKENELLNNDMILNQQLRSLLSNLEQKERINSVQRSEVFQDMLQKTSYIIIFGGGTIGLIILFFIINIIRDITRSQRYRAELEEAKTFAESLLARREQFMAAITHDLRSPLTTVMGYTDLMQKTNLDHKQKHYLLQVKKSSQFILRLVNDLLDLSKLEAGKMLIEKLPFNPKKLIKDTVGNIIPAEKNKDVEIIIRVSDETNTQVQSDPFRIKQVLANLISNAWKFTEKGSIIISAELEQQFNNEAILEIRVKDTGIGISKEMQESIFEEFSQENSSIEKRFGGSGLGLAITKRLSELLKGDISVNSTQGEGSEFILRIPVVKTEASTSAKAEKPVDTPQIADGSMTGKKVLIVDDEPGQLSLTEELARSMGFSIETAINGKIALEKLDSDSFDLVLTDIQMPVKDGFSLIQTIREDQKLKDLPVIALSGRTDLKKEAYTKAGFDNNLLKPYKPASLRKAIATIFNLENKPEKTEEASEHSKLKAENYDLRDIYEFSGNDEVAMQTILQAFLEGAEKSKTQLEKAYNDNDRETMAKLAHRMLPMLRQMQANSITSTLEKIEDREDIEQQEFEQLQRNLEDLMKSLESDAIV